MNAGASGGYTFDIFAVRANYGHQAKVERCTLGASCKVFEGVSNASMITAALNAGLVVASQSTMGVCVLT